MKRNVRTLVLGVGAIHLALVGCGGGGGKGGASADDGGLGAIDLAVTTDGNVPPDSVMCAQLAAAAGSEFESSFSLACQVDSDCSLLHLRSLDCFAGCGQLVRVADISTATALAASACDQYFGAGCPETVPLCPARFAICDQGVCNAVLPTGPASGSADAAVDAGIGEVPIDGGNTSEAQDSALVDASTIVDGGVCTWPSNLTPNGDDFAGGCWAHAVPGAADASLANCSLSEYALHCVGEMDRLDSGCETLTMPAPDPLLGCRVLPLPTAANASYYCCPCGQSQTSLADASVFMSSGCP
jgi:hypothetical protein